MKEFLSQNNIKHVYLDISESMMNLKRFLKYRDSRPEFDRIKKYGSIGLPCVVVNDGEQILFDKSDIEKLIQY